LILGVNAYHGDASACLIDGGRIVVAIEEERLRRVKHWAGFPEKAIQSCLAMSGIRIEDVEHVAVNSDNRANRWRKLGYVLAHRPSPKLLLEKLANRSKRSNTVQRVAELLGGAHAGIGVHPVEHHKCHLYSTYSVSPFNEAVVVSVDGFGDFSSAAWGVGRGDALSVDGYVHFPHSLGVFYEAVTQYLGFPHYGDEYKVMGLAPYGEPAYLNEMRRIVHSQNGTYALDLSFFRHHRHEIGYEWDDGAPKVGRLYSDRLIDLFGPARADGEALSQNHKDLAHSAQAMYEEAFFHLLNSVYQRYNIPNLCLAGGCAMNSVANGKVRINTPFEQVYVQPAAGDAGGAIGAALAVWHESCGGKREFTMDHAYWGPGYTDNECEVALNRAGERLLEFKWRQLEEESVLCDHVSKALQAGKVVGWFQGRMEWGPRALGNRSILGDPRRPDMKDILNAKIKRRESFRPFAPAILRGLVDEWFTDDVDVPFMTEVHPVRPDKRDLVPAVTHVDGSGRLQTVTRDANPRFYRLIETFGTQTGVPMLLNTSFNENEPIINRPEEALDCFLRTGMDMLVLGSHVVERN